MKKIILLVIMLLAFVGCRGEGEYHPPETTHTPSHTQIETEVTTHIESEPYTTQPTDPQNEIRRCLQTDNIVPTYWDVPTFSLSNVQVHFVTCETLTTTPHNWQLDLDQIPQYHKFHNHEVIDRWKSSSLYLQWGIPSIVITTETTVSNFQLLEISHNWDSWEYDILDVLYTLDKLAPETPFVVIGADLGYLFANNGFSFVDEEGITRYFAFSSGLCECAPPIVFHEFWLNP